MAARISRFSRYLIRFGQNTPSLHCLKAYTPFCKTRVSVANITYEVRSERLEEIARSPSGWVPPQSPPPSLPFEIKRSKNNNLPVYIDKKRGGSLVLTVIRNIKGDLNELGRFLKENLGEDVHFQTNEVTSQVKIKGYHKEAVKLFRLFCATMSSKDDKGAEQGSTDDRPGASGGADEETSTDGLPNYLQALLERLGIRQAGDSKSKQEPKIEQVLDEVTFEGIAKYIQTEKCQHIVTMAGAGISTAAGIPDFRSPGTGLYDNLQQYNLPYPEAIFEIGFFNSNPEPFFTLAKELYPGNFKPTTSHYFLRLLNEKGLLLRHYTQNIDTLERIAGVPGDSLVEAHGTFYTAHCLKCRKQYTQDWIKNEIFADNIPTCEKENCDGVVKPDIVFFGESLPERFSSCLSKDMAKCDLLIIMGTSLAVQPFASIVDHVRETTPRLLINREKCGQRLGGHYLMFDGGLMFDDPKNYRDVAWLGSCDDGCLALAELLGWKDELMELVKSEHEKIDKMSAAENKQKEEKEELPQIKSEVETPGDTSQVVDEKQSDKSECVGTAGSEETKDGGDGSKSEIST